jgi:SAM-dependent methyltransferase
MHARLRTLKNQLKLIFASPSERRHSKVGDAQLWKMKRDFQIAFLKRIGLKPEHLFLDIGCGTLRGGLPIIAYLDQRHYYGIEARQDVLDEGRQELIEAGLEGKEPILVCAQDFSTVKFEKAFDCIWAFSVLIHMDDEILDGCLRFVSENLAPDGYFYANVNLGTEPDGLWQGFPVIHRSFDFYRGASLRNGLLVDDIGSLASLGHISTIQKQDEQRMLKFWKS